MKTATNYLSRVGQFAWVALAAMAWVTLLWLTVNWLLPRKAPLATTLPVFEAPQNAPSAALDSQAPETVQAPATPDTNPTPAPLEPKSEDRGTAASEKPRQEKGEDIVEILLASADWRRKTGDVTGSLTSCLSLIEKYPGTGATAARGQLDVVFAQLNRREITFHRDDLEKLLSLAAQCGELKVIPAMLFLGDHFKTQSPKEAYGWYSKAADLGNPEALRTVGDYYFSGISGFLPSDLSRAVELYEKAVDKGDLRAKACLGQLYLEGRGVPGDEARGLKLLREASAEKKDARAMNFLGNYLYTNAGRHSLAQRQQDYDEAFHLFSACQEIHDLNGLANLAVMYMAGKAPGLTEPDERRGASLFADGAKGGNPTCMYYYAFCLEGGVGVKKNRLDAEYWYVKAAKAGEPRSIQWCKSHNPSLIVSLPSPPLGDS